MEQDSEAVRRLVILEELQSLLSSDTEVRQSAEQKIKKLEVTEGYGIYLTELIMNKSFELPLRQIACIMLQRFIENYWGSNNDDVTTGGGNNAVNNVSGGEMINEETKRVIRNILPNGLYDTNSKIRLSVAHAISMIAANDWPTMWPELFDIIVNCLESNEDAIHGALQILQDDFTFDGLQIKELGPAIITQANRIFASEQNYSVKTRASILGMLKPFFLSISVNIAIEREQSSLMNSILNEMIDKLLYYLSMNSGTSSNFYMRTEIAKLFTFLLTDMSHSIVPFVERILPVIWQLLTQVADIYVQVIVNRVQSSPFPIFDDVNNADINDDEMGNFISMIVQIFEFIETLIGAASRLQFRSAFNNVLTDLIYIIIVYIQIPEEQLEVWEESPDTYLEDEYDGGLALTIRVAGQDILVALNKEFGAKVLSPLHEALRRHMNVVEAEKATGNMHWWKIQEACMAAVHCYRCHIVEMEDQFNLLNYLTMIPNWLNYPYLVGRALNTLSTYNPVKLYNHQTFEQLLNVTLQSLQQGKPINLKICAAQAVHDILLVHRRAKNERRNIIQTKLLGFFEGIVALIPGSTSSVTSMLLEALDVIILFDATFTANIQGKLIPMLLGIFLKHSEDPIIVDIMQGLIKKLCRNTHCLIPIQEAFVPTIVDILMQPDHHAKQDIALDILTTIVRNSKAPLNPLLVERAFPIMVHLALKSDDLEIMVAGSECLRAYVAIDPEQICKYKSGEGLSYVIEMTTMLLNPMTSEMTARQVGRLVITIISKLGNMLGEKVDLLLKAVVSKMQLADALKVVMNLVVVFAHLFLTQMEATLNFLTTVPGPSGEPAIQFVLGKWLAKQNCFYGTYELKITTMALCKLFEYGVTTQDARLTSINVQELVMPEAVQSNGRVKTRSQTQAVNTNIWVTIPAVVKIFKLLINEVYHIKEAKQQSDSETDDTDEDDYQERYDNGSGGITDTCTAGGDANNTSTTGAAAAAIVANISPSKTHPDNYDNVGDAVPNDDEDENDNDDDDDNDLMKDLMKNPLFQTDTELYLTNFLQNFITSEHFPMFVSHLTVAEKNILKYLDVNNS